MICELCKKRTLRHKNRQKIMTILEQNSEINIKTLAEKVGLAYKNVLAHIKQLSKVGLIETNKQEKKQGREVLIKNKGGTNNEH